MFIRKTTHTNNKNGQKYFTYKLVESIRTQRGPRQHIVFNIGRDFNLSQDKWKELADRIENILSGQKSLFPVSDEIERLAKKYAKKIIRRHGQAKPEVYKERISFE